MGVDRRFIKYIGYGMRLRRFVNLIRITYPAGGKASHVC